MTPAAILALMDLSLKMVETLGPRIAELRNKGLITADEQLTLDARISAIRSGGAFAGEQWKPEA